MLEWHLKFQPETLAGAGKPESFGPLILGYILYLNQNGPIQNA
jgi:hypothetical protein